MIQVNWTHSCMMLETAEVTWSEADVACTATGGNLATFPTMEALFWFFNFRDEHAGM